MPADLVATFERSLDELGVTAARTTADRAAAAVGEAVDPPAVGTPLPFEDISLPDDVTVRPTPRQLREAATGVTAAGSAIAEYGTLIIQSRPAGDEPVSLYPERHVAVVRAGDLVPDVAEAFAWLGGEFAAGRSSAVLATGVSATADMGEMIEGVHGPGEVHVVIVEDR